MRAHDEHAALLLKRKEIDALWERHEWQMEECRKARGNYNLRWMRYAFFHSDRIHKNGGPCQ